MHRQLFTLSKTLIGTKVFRCVRSCMLSLRHGDVPYLVGGRSFSYKCVPAVICDETVMSAADVPIRRWVPRLLKLGDATDEQWVELALLLKLVPDTGRMQMLTGWLIVVTEYWRRLIASEDRTDRYAVWLHRVEMMTWRASWWVWGHSLVLTSLIDSTHTNRVEWRYSGTVGSTSLCQ